MKSLVTFLLVTLCTAMCRAEEPATSDPGLLFPLPKDKLAPFSGVLFSPRAAASIATSLSTADDRLKIEIEKAVSEAVAKKDYDYGTLNNKYVALTTKSQADAEYSAKRIEDLESRLARSEESSPNRTLWFGLGAASGVVVTIATVFAVANATK